MNESNPNPVEIRFTPETRFTLSPVIRDSARGCLEWALDQLKDRLLSEVLLAHQDQDMEGALRLAANEAAALAWTTPYPLLLFPVLLEEKTVSVRARAVRQAQIRKRIRLPLEPAA